jgi:hypothetical protein
MVEIELIDETFDINITSQYDLSIQVSPDGYCFSILDPRRTKYILLKNYLIAEEYNNQDFASYIGDLQEKDEFLSKDYHSVRIIYSTQRSTLVPSSLFSESHKEDYFAFVHTIMEDENILVNKLLAADSVNLFVIPQVIEKRLMDRFPNAGIFHQSSSFIENLLADAQSKSKDSRVYVHVARGFFDIAVTSQGKLELYNSFRYTTESDFAFFILYVFDQLKLDPEETVLRLSGEISRDSAHYDLIRTFVRNLSFEKYNSASLYSYVFTNIAAHRFHNLLNLYHCGS